MCQGSASLKSTVTNASHKFGNVALHQGNAAAKGHASNRGHRVGDVDVRQRQAAAKACSSMLLTLVLQFPYQERLTFWV